ncbi:MAG: type II toxin-antitoxin system RelE/ParE family toxin [Spirochaetaceae bacterium]|jgi:hypothetical protein|nr:type II toxin-antitoxin system RelE/ParE family toxin [Spirochaetaceae bacterium]
MRIFKSKWFERFARKNSLTDEALRAAVAEIEAGNFSANLGGNVYKQRVARQGQGKSGGYRTIVLLKHGERAFFVYGFAKSELDNIDDKDIKRLKENARDMLNMNNTVIANCLRSSSLVEI